MEWGWAGEEAKVQGWESLSGVGDSGLAVVVWNCEAEEGVRSFYVTSLPEVCRWSWGQMRKRVRGLVV